MIIDNKKLIEKNHQFRLRESLEFNEDFVIVPKYVFLPLSKWYDCNLIIKRTVHQSKIFQNIVRSNIRRNNELRQSKNRGQGPMFKSLLSPTEQQK